MPGMYKTIEGSITGSSDGNDSPPPGGNIRVAVQPWAPSGGHHHGNHVRSDSIDSLDSNSSGSSGFNHTRQLSGDSTEYIPTRNIPKTVTQPSHNPLRFVKVQSSSLYLKAEEQIKLTKEVKITRHSLRDDEEEWQANLSSWKSRRKQQSEKVIQRAEVMREIEAEEQRLQQQRKVKTFSEMMEERANKPRSYNFAIYPPENEEERADSRSGYIADKEDKAASASDCCPSESETDPGSEEASYNMCDHTPNADENRSSYKYCNQDEVQSCSYPEKVLMHSYVKDDSEMCSSEEEFVTERKRVSEELGLSVVNTSTDSGLESLGRSGDVGDSALDFGHDNNILLDKPLSDSEKETMLQSSKLPATEDSAQHEKISTSKNEHAADKDLRKLQIWLKHSSDLRGFGFTLRGGKDQGTPVFVDTVIKGGASDLAGLRVDDEIKEINGESCFGRCHSALVFAVKQAVYTGLLDLVIKRSSTAGTPDGKDDVQPQIISRRGSAFAQKIAMFNCNADSHSSQESQKCEKQDLRNKGESFVLRRRSTFETATKNKEETINNRWSTSFSRDSHYGGSFTVQDRKHSFESLANIDHATESKPIKKLPPPVPAKPKNKMSASIESLPDTMIRETYTVNLENSERIHIVENGISPQYLQVSTSPSKMTSSPILGGKTLIVSDSEIRDITPSPQDNSVKSLKELCEDCTQIPIPVTHQTQKEEGLAQNEEKPQELCNDLNGDSENSCVVKPFGYSVVSEGNLNIVYDSHSDTNTDVNESCQKEVLQEVESKNECSNVCVNITLNEVAISFSPASDIEETVRESCDIQSPPATNSNEEMQQYDAKETEESQIIPESTEVYHATVASEIAGSIPDNNENDPAPQEQQIEHFDVQQCPKDFIIDEHTIQETQETLAPVDTIAEQMELMILNQLAEGNENIEISSAELALCMGDEQQSLLNDFDTVPRQFEPPKEKPPPPPSEEETEPLKITVTSIARANSTKRIKQEIQKRRSNFLGLEVHDTDINIDDYILQPVAVEDILRSEVELRLSEKPMLINQVEGNDNLEEQQLNESEMENYEAFIDNTEEIVDSVHQVYNTDLNSEYMSPKEITADNYEEQLCEDMFTTEQIENSLNVANTLEAVPEPVPSYESSESFYIIPEKSEGMPVHVECLSPNETVSSKNNDETTKDSEAPQPIKRQHLLLSLGAAPKAKIIHENEWIKQNEATTVKQQSMPLLEGSIYDTAPWDKENGQNVNEIISSERKVINDRCALPPLTFDTSSKHPPAPPPKPGSTTSPLNEEVSNSDQGSSQIVHYVISPVSDSSEDSDSISAPGYTWNYEQIQPPDSREMSEHQQPKPNEVCGVCSKELGYGEVIIIDSVLFPYHSDCFNCSICNTELNSQASVQFLNNTLACQTCVDTRTAVKSNSPGESSSRL